MSASTYPVPGGPAQVRPDEIRRHHSIFLWLYQRFFRVIRSASERPLLTRGTQRGKPNIALVALAFAFTSLIGLFASGIVLCTSLRVLERAFLLAVQDKSTIGIEYSYVGVPRGGVLP